MSIGFQNYDSSFFQIKVEGLPETSKLNKDISDKIISLEIVEEMGKVITGNIQLLDEDLSSGDILQYTNVLKGKWLAIKWGYSNMDLSGNQLFRKMENPKELWSKTLVNRYVNARIKNPSGGGDENGVFTFNCAFMGNEYFDKTTPRKRFTSGTKAELVKQVFKDMGIDSSYVNFRRGNEKLSKDTAVTQGESNFRFLSRYATEWRAMFRIATTNKKTSVLNGVDQYAPVGLFCDYDDDASVRAFLYETLGTEGESSSFDYKMVGSPNVKSYTWQYHQGENGSGDNVRVVKEGNQLQFYFQKADTEKVTYYKLNTKRMQSELSKQGNIANQAEWLTRMFKEAEGGMENLTKGPNPYFMPCDSSTAPQGMGLSATLEVIGNPLFTCPARAKFGVGFPDFFHIKDGLTFYQTRVSHKINRSGYTCTIQVADAYTTSGGSLVG